MASSLGSHISLRTSDHMAVKFLSFNERERHSINFKFSKVPRRILSCKPEDLEFQVRTSPNEVNPFCKFSSIFEFSLRLVVGFRDICPICYSTKCEFIGFEERTSPELESFSNFNLFF